MWYEYIVNIWTTYLHKQTVKSDSECKGAFYISDLNMHIHTVVKYCSMY